MKFLSLLLLSNWTILTAQPNFKIVNNNTLEWVKIYETNLSADQIKESLIKSGMFKVEDKTENYIQLTFDGLAADYRGAGYNKMGMTGYVVMNDLKASVIVEFKPGRYKVTINNIDLMQKEDRSDYITKDISMDSSKDTKEDLERFAINKKGAFAGSFINKASKVYDYTFNKLFEIKEAATDDW